MKHLVLKATNIAVSSLLVLTLAFSPMSVLADEIDTTQVQEEIQITSEEPAGEVAEEAVVTAEVPTDDETVVIEEAQPEAEVQPEVPAEEVISAETDAEVLPEAEVPAEVNADEAVLVEEVVEETAEAAVPETVAPAEEEEVLPESLEGRQIVDGVVLSEVEEFVTLDVAGAPTADATLSSGNYVTGIFEKTKQDKVSYIYKFVIPHSSRIRIDYDVLSNAQTSRYALWTGIGLFDGNGYELNCLWSVGSSWAIIEAGKHSYEMDIEPGTYYVAVNRFNSTSGQFKLAVSWQQVTDETNAKNDVPMSATILSQKNSIVSGFNKLQKGQIALNSPREFYQFYLSRRQHVVITLNTNMTNGLSRYNMQVRTRTSDEYIDKNAYVYYDSKTDPKYKEKGYLEKGQQTFDLILDEGDYYLIVYGQDQVNTGEFSLKVVAEEFSPVAMYRLYNRSTGEHFYTDSAKERDDLVKSGKWRFEGVSWYAPKSSNKPIWRLYHPGKKAHHYTGSANEKDTLCGLGKYAGKGQGWIVEKIGWYSAPDPSSLRPEEQKYVVPVYRAYHPGWPMVSAHHYTTDKHEIEVICGGSFGSSGFVNDPSDPGTGWVYEGIAWYGVANDEYYQ